MIQSYRSKANVGILIGIVVIVGVKIYVVGGIYHDNSHYTELMRLSYAGLINYIGLAVFVIGCCLYAKSKGRSPFWGLFGLVWLIGLIVIACLKDLAPAGSPADQRGFEVMPPQYPPRPPYSPQ